MLMYDGNHNSIIDRILIGSSVLNYIYIRYDYSMIREENEKETRIQREEKEKGIIFGSNEGSTIYEYSTCSSFRGIYFSILKFITQCKSFYLCSNGKFPTIFPHGYTLSVFKLINIHSYILIVASPGAQLGSLSLVKRLFWFPNEQHIILGYESTPPILITPLVEVYQSNTIIRAILYILIVDILETNIITHL